MTEDEDTQRFRVVVNGEEQYSIWPLEHPVPPGWHELAVEGSRDDCLAYIKDAWTDLRPQSLRRP